MKKASSARIDIMEALATKCTHGISCLDTGCCGNRKMCKVERSSGDSILFLEGEIAFGCPYLLPFGYGHLCTCPVHARLHRSGGKYAKEVKAQAESGETPIK